MSEVLEKTRGAETREKLIATVLAMLEDRSPEDLRVEEVLDRSTTTSTTSVIWSRRP
jgi:hypothetical protein